MGDKDITAIAKEIITNTAQPAIFLKTIDEPTTRYNSKLGGIPYLPPGFTYPTVDENPMIFLAQINFEEFEGIEEFPSKGIIQFYLDNDDSLGMDFEDEFNRKGYKVVYFENIEKDETKLQQPPKIESDSYLLSGECKFIGNRGECSIDVSDFRFNALIKKYIAKYELEEDGENELFDKCSEKSSNARTTHMGAYASFTQTDPRDYSNKMKDYSVTLFHLESESVGEREVIMWGDCGVCNFFITPEDLKNKNFENVLFQWDCY